MATLPKGAIGYKKDLTEKELAHKHIDGPTGLVFKTEEDYLEYKHPKKEEEEEEEEEEE